MYLSECGISTSSQLAPIRAFWFRTSPPVRVLGKILDAWARRRDVGNLKHTLDLMQELGLTPLQSDLKHVRYLVDKGRFDHAWLPADPKYHVKRVGCVSSTFFLVKLVGGRSVRLESGRNAWPSADGRACFGIV